MNKIKRLLWAGAVLLLPILAIGEDRSYWVRRYLSVSYPLEHIEVTSGYGMRKDPFGGGSKRHNGIDLRAKGSKVLAMFDGTVENTGFDDRSGIYVMLRHGEYLISYCHLSRLLVKTGDEVLAGDAVGVSGSTGRSTGEHLHITCRRGGDTVDPMELLRGIREVRRECALALGYAAETYQGHRGTPQETFIRRYAPAAIEQSQRYGIPASVTLAQMALESKWGESRLAKESNNYFGIKASETWVSQGREFRLYDDDRKGERFCVFADAQESIEYHSRLLMGDRYRECRRYASDDWQNWLRAIKRCGYATSKSYVEDCSRVIQTYKLWEYD